MQLNQKLKTAIDSAQSILISTHIFPDADGIGSQISLCLALRSMGKDCICVNEEELLERYKYLDKQNVVTSIENAKDTKPDLIIIVDTNTKERTGKKMMNYYSSVGSNFLFIDHHPCSAVLSEDHCIDISAAATGQIIGEFTEFMGIPFNKEMALALYTSIIIDTSSFRYPTVSSRTHLLVSKLLQTGIEPTTAYNGIYGTKTIQHLHLLGKILGSAKSNEAGNIYWIVFDQDDLDAFETDIEDTHAFINHLLIMDNIKVACMIRDNGDQVKVSLRSTGICDVGIIATALGGGGHSHSAATVIKKTKPIDEIIKETIETIEGCLKD